MSLDKQGPTLGNSARAGELQRIWEAIHRMQAEHRDYLDIVEDHAGSLEHLLVLYRDRVTHRLTALEWVGLVVMYTAAVTFCMAAVATGCWPYTAVGAVLLAIAIFYKR